MKNEPNNQIDEVMLLAYIEGEAPAEIATKIENDPSLLLRVEELRLAENRLEMWLSSGQNAEFKLPLPSVFRKIKLVMAEQIDLFATYLKQM